jgi:hypothetical protein
MKTDFKVGDLVEIVDDSGALSMMIEQGFIKGNTFKIRNIGSKNFHNDGGGIRLQGITLWKDLDLYEQCFSRKRFKKL